MSLPLYLSFPLPLLSFLCTAALLNILHLIALQTGAFYSGLYLHGKYFAVQAGSSRQAGSQLSHLSTSLYSHPPCICRHLAPFYWLPSSFLGSQFLFTFAASLWLVLCVVFGTFSTKHFTLFIFATIALRFQVAFEVFVLSVGAQFHQCCQCCLPAWQCCLPAAAVCTYFACLPLALS